MNNINKKHFNKIVGDFGENIASDLLINNGHLIIEKNYRNRLGEIDIVSLKDNIVHFSEVKTVIRETRADKTYKNVERFMNNTKNSKSISRETLSNVIHETYSLYKAEDNVHESKLRKLIVLAEIYMGENVLEYDYQIDVIAVTILKRGEKFFKKIKVFESVS